MPFALYCSVCNEPFTFFENIANRALQRCNACDQRLQAYQEDTLAWIVQAFEKPAGVSEEMERIIYDQLEAFHLPLDLEAPITAKLSYLRLLSKIRGGDFPHVQIPNHLDTDEYAHFEIKATHVSRVGQKVKEVPGQLIGTNKKAYFIADSGKGGATLSWNNVSQTRAEEFTVQDDTYTTTYQVLRILVSKGQGGGDYDVDDILFTKTFIDALVKRWRRQLVEKRVASGYVPDHIKAQVYHRDGGRCVECGYQGPYIEYDHIYPRSKGGPSTVENIQLLCGICNRKKGDKI